LLSNVSSTTSLDEHPEIAKDIDPSFTKDSPLKLKRLIQASAFERPTLEDQAFKTWSQKVNKKTSRIVKEDLFVIGTSGKEQKVFLPPSTWFTDNPLGMFIRMCCMHYKVKIEEVTKTDFPILTYPDRTEKFFNGFLLEATMPSCVKPSLSKDPYAQGASAFVVEVLLRELGETHSITHLNIPSIYLGSEMLKRPKLLELNLRSISVNHKAVGAMRGIFRYMVKKLSSETKIVKKPELFISFEQAWAKTGRKIKQNRRLASKIIHAKRPDRLRGIHSKERTLVNSTFCSPWNKLEQIKQKWSQKIVKNGFNAIYELHELNRIMWKVHEVILQLTRRRLNLLYDGKEYNLAKLNYDEDLKKFYENHSVKKEWVIPGILTWTGITSFASKVFPNVATDINSLQRDRIPQGLEEAKAVIENLKNKDFPVTVKDRK
jgi:hypothetical protein